MWLVDVFRHLELFQELFIMREFEQMESALYEKLEEKTTEKLNMDKQVTTVACLTRSTVAVKWLIEGWVNHG